MGSLRAEADALCASPAFKAALRRHSRHIARSRLDLLSTRIHPDDPMLGHSLRHHADANRSVSQYFNVALQQHNALQQVLRSFFASDLDSRTILDFACGHGRNLRFLAPASPNGKVWGCDIQQEAVDFVAAEFGVHALYSTVDPDRFSPGRTFDFIWVASLFSHLPERLFHHWLGKLASLLTDDGVLCFSVHGEVMLPAHIPMPAGGFFYSSVSENAQLDGSIYGATYVTDAYVTEALAKLSGTLSGHYRIPRGLANEQDLYIATRKERDFAGLAAFRRGAWGWVEHLAISGDDALRVQGWAGSLDDGALGRVEIIIGNQIHHAPTDVRRDDVARVLGDQRLAASGFDFSSPLDRRIRHPFLEVIARSRRDESAMIYAGPIKFAPQP
jgi:SAM-dependent methyltransferase